MSHAGPPALVGTAVVAALGLVVGFGVNALAARFPWQPRPGEIRRGPVRRPLVEVGTALLFGLTAVRFGPTWELPAYLFLAAAGMLLAVIDVRHKLLPDRVTLPAIGIGAALLAVAALGMGEWAPFARAALSAVALLVLFFALALLSPRSIGVGDAKLAALLGLYLGWLGTPVVVVGIAAGFVVQAVFALVLLASRRIGLRGELPFGPAMLLGAALAIGWSDALLR